MGRKRKQSVFAIFLILFSSFFSTVEYAGAETQNESGTININCEDGNATNPVVSEGAITSGSAITSGGAITTGGAVVSGGAVITGSAVQSTNAPIKGETGEIPEIKEDDTACSTTAPGAIPVASLAPATKGPVAAVTKQPIPVATEKPIVTIAPVVTTVPEVTKAPIVTNTPIPTATPELLPDETPIPTVEPTPLVTVIPTQNVEAQKPSNPTNAPVDSPTKGEDQSGNNATPSICTVHYVLNGGQNHTQNPKKIVNINVPINLHNAKRRGYLFKGWYTESTYKHKISRIANTQKSSITLYARWKKVSVGKAGISSAKSLKNGKMKVKVKRKESVKGYEYMYSTSPTFSKKYRVRTTKNPKVLSKLKKGVVYYIKVRSYKIDSYGKKVYGTYSKVVKCKIKRK